MKDLIASTLKWAFILAAAGELKTATLIMMRKAAEASAPGLISLSALKRSLQNPSSPHSAARQKR